MNTRGITRLGFIPVWTLLWVGTGAAAQEITTKSVTSRRHEIKADRLPRPDEKQSVNNRPTTVKAPAQPVLEAPPGFRVTVFASNVDGARWLVLSPTGDVLVTQKRGSDITLLRDKDRDGTAEHRSRFAGSGNALNQPFGIAFTGDAVLIANTDGVRRY